jgi:membrane fusion protein (multidrug efflux system)
LREAGVRVTGGGQPGPEPAVLPKLLSPQAPESDGGGPHPTAINFSRASVVPWQAPMRAPFGHSLRAGQGAFTGRDPVRLHAQNTSRQGAFDMKKRMLIMLTAVVLFLSAIGFVKFQQIQAAIAAGQSFTPPPEAVTTVVVKPEGWQATLDATGTVVPVQGVTLSADLPGVVDKILFESGSHVREGDALVALDTRQERAQLASAEAQLELARSRLDRSSKLLDRQLIAQAEYDDVVAQERQAEAAVNEIKATIERKTIRAPFTGHAGIRLVNLGQYVHSGDPIVPLQSHDPIFVNFAVPQQQVSDLRVGATVEAAADSGSNAVTTGRITAINPVVDQATRNVQVQATFRNDRENLRAGAYVNVQVMVGQQASTLAIPASAINYAPYGNSVYIVEKMKGPSGNEYLGVRQQFVYLGRAKGDQVAVLKGVKAGDEVVTSGVFKLRPNAAVMVDNSVQPSNSLHPQPANS